MQVSPQALTGRWTAVLFDRDGTLIEDVPYNGDPALVRPVPGARAALDRLRAAGFKIGDLFGGRGGKGRKVAAKYVNPDDPSETWTGRGRKPRWLSAKLKEGDRIEKFLIK